jgi:hypothetical protein
MAYKIHLLVSVKGKTACNSNAVGNGKVTFNSRKAMEFIPDSHKVNPEDFALHQLLTVALIAVTSFLEK